MISHEMTRTMETALAEWVRLQAAALVQAANTETAAHVVIGLLAWASDQGFSAAPAPLYEGADWGFVGGVVVDARPFAEDLAIWLFAMAWNCDPSDPIASMAQDAAERQFVKASPCVPTPESAPAQETTGSA